MLKESKRRSKKGSKRNLSQLAPKNLKLASKLDS